MAPKARLGSDTLVGSVEQRAQSGKRRRLERRDTDQQATRCLEEQFPGCDSVTTDMKKVKGLTLRERITQDKSAANKSGDRLGSGYWSGLRREYNINTTTEDSIAAEDPLTVRDKSLVANPEFKGAVHRCKGSNLTKISHVFQRTSPMRRA